ncbi:MAG: hypothetical protein PHN42_04200 [Bacilli bacterium]|nr:hypothetical protein [Bacilli bacterium]
MDLIIIVVLSVIILIWKKNFESFVYFLGISEIFFRIMHFISENINVTEITNLINKYIPTSLLGVLANYTDGLFYNILAIGLVICFVALEIYLIKYWFKRK